MKNNKDWIGNNKSVYTTLGASSHALDSRQNEDYYATHPSAIKKLLEVEEFTNVWEPACGEGHLSKALEEAGIVVYSTDLIERGYGGVLDFLADDRPLFMGDIITNPPYKYAEEFVRKAIKVVRDGGKVAMFLKVTFLEGIKRQKLFREYPPKIVYIFSKRVPCAKNGEFDKYPSSAIAYAWYVWEVGHKGTTLIKWI